MRRHFTSVLSRLFGRFASHPFPAIVQHTINAAYVKFLGLEMREFDAPACYPTLNALFTRPLKRERTLPEDADKLISPVDARITDYGTIKEGKAYQIKGMAYDIASLFGEYHRAAAEWVKGGSFVNFYLSPKDYHRYHMPTDLKVVAMTHIPGKLYPVNIPLLKNKPSLFVENERVVIECEDMFGRIYVLVLVGALNVGKMVVAFEPDLRTNTDRFEAKHYRYDDKEIVLTRGELLGWFEMGSTVVMFVQKGAVKLETALNQKVRFGDSIGKILKGEV